MALFQATGTEPQTPLDPSSLSYPLVAGVMGLEMRAIRVSETTIHDTPYIRPIEQTLAQAVGSQGYGMHT